MHGIVHGVASRALPSPTSQQPLTCSGMRAPSRQRHHPAILPALEAGPMYQLPEACQGKWCALVSAGERSE